SSFADEYVANGHRRILLLCRTAKYRKKSPICSWFVLNSDRLLGGRNRGACGSVNLRTCGRTPSRHAAWASRVEHYYPVLSVRGRPAFGDCGPSWLRSLSRLG